MRQNTDVIFLKFIALSDTNEKGINSGQLEFQAP
jgi:hypothetical protein